MKALVFGSLNIDYVYSVDHIVMQGETLDSNHLTALPGGKGLNQAVALSKAGMNTFMAGLIGKDGMFLKDILEENQVDTSYVKRLQETSGHAIIQVDSQGKNSIVLYGGTNRMVTEPLIDEVLSQFDRGDLLLLQNEINMLDSIILKAKAKGMVVALNPSPMNGTVEQLDLNDIDILIMNEVEGAQISGVSSDEPEQILEEIYGRYNSVDLMLTLGKAGSVFMDHETKQIFRQEAIDVLPIIDTTGAGDTFTGFFLAGWIKREETQQIMRRASIASGIAVGRKGAAISIPTLDEVNQI